MADGRPYLEPYNPYYYETPPRRFGTSGAELLHIAIAMLALAAALFIVFDKNQEGYKKIHEAPLAFKIAAAISISFFAFVLHELGHKFTAQHFGYWSEFRASFVGLAMALGFAFAFGIPAAAPGATWHNAHSKRDQGKISAAGPLVNYIVAFAAFPFTVAKGASSSLEGQLASIVMAFSAILALFNLIPLGPLDGRKVLSWNPVVWVLMVTVGILIIYYNQQIFNVLK